MNYDMKVYRVPPPEFLPTMEVSACYIEFAGKLLLLKRAAHKPQGDTWGVAAGKLEKGETPRQAVFREVYEEAGIILDEERLNSHGKYYVRYPHLDFVYHVFHQELALPPKLQLSDEHVESRFVTFEEALTLPLISGGAEALHHFRALSKTPLLKRKEFFFIRHGETDANQSHKVDGDFPLNSRGIAQATSARETIKPHQFKNVCHSPIKRAVETKDLLITQGMSEEEIAYLSECTAAIWRNMVMLEEGSGYTPCTETEQFLYRAISGVNEALEHEGPLLIVAHGGIHWVLCYLLKIENHPWKIGNCQLVHFRPIGDEGWEASI